MNVAVWLVEERTVDCWRREVGGNDDVESAGWSAKGGGSGHCNKKKWSGGAWKSVREPTSWLRAV